MIKLQSSEEKQLWIGIVIRHMVTKCESPDEFDVTNITNIADITVEKYRERVEKAPWTV